MNWVDKLKQTGTYWSKGASDGYNAYSYGTPAAITCRWDDTSEEFIDDTGERKISRAVIWTTTALVQGGYLYLGTSAATDPTAVTNAWMIRSVQRVGSVNNTEAIYKAYL